MPFPKVIMFYGLLAGLSNAAMAQSIRDWKPEVKVINVKGLPSVGYCSRIADAFEVYGRLGELGGYFDIALHMDADTFSFHSPISQSQANCQFLVQIKTKANLCYSLESIEASGNATIGSSSHLDLYAAVVDHIFEEGNREGKIYQTRSDLMEIKGDLDGAFVRSSLAIDFSENPSNPLKKCQTLTQLELRISSLLWNNTDTDHAKVNKYLFKFNASRKFILNGDIFD